MKLHSVNAHIPQTEVSFFDHLLIIDRIDVIVRSKMPQSIRRSLSLAGIALGLIHGGALYVPAQTPPPQNRTLAVIVVLDKSGSTSGALMNSAKEGTKIALEQMRGKDFFGVMTFDYNFQWVVQLSEIQNKEPMREAIDRISASGNTNMYRALRAAYDELKTAKSDFKHIILLSDGITPAEDFTALVSEMRKDSITVSTVATGVVSNRDLMAEIAAGAGGRTYQVTNVQAIPEVLRNETAQMIWKALQ